MSFGMTLGRVTRLKDRSAKQLRRRREIARLAALQREESGLDLCARSCGFLCNRRHCCFGDGGRIMSDVLLLLAPAASSTAAAAACAAAGQAEGGKLR